MNAQRLVLLGLLIVPLLALASGCAGPTVAGTAPDSFPRVVVLAHGYVEPIEGRNPIPGSDDGARRVASTVVLIEAAGAVIVADPGMVADRAIIVDALRAEGILPRDVTHVFISHHHPDHTLNAAMFPRAAVVDFWGVYQDDLWEDHPDHFEIAPGVRVVRTPGHTHEDASLLIEASDGTYAITHLWWNEQMQPEVDPLAEDAEAMEVHRDMILREADWIIPGHGRMFRNPSRG
ncbi:MAG: MBL fold metallo-hydrolase [Planctomycetota bacterium]